MEEQMEAGFARGDVVLDVLTKRVGVVMDRDQECYSLRPVGGGVEWDCPAKYVTQRQTVGS